MFGGQTVELGANWMHYAGLEEGQENPLKQLIEDAGLNTVEDSYEDYIFRYRGMHANVFVDILKLFYSWKV